MTPGDKMAALKKKMPYVDKLTFLEEQSTIAAYRVMNMDGEISDASQDPKVTSMALLLVWKFSVQRLLTQVC
jgi:hypothetical protein